MKKKEIYTPGPRPLYITTVLLAIIIITGVLFIFIKEHTVQNTKSDSLIQENGTIRVTFCPTQNCAAAFTTALQNTTTINCAFYELNEDNIEQALKEKKAKVLIFNENVKKTTVNATAIPSDGLMHHKFCILDDAIVITGSMNPTFNDVVRNNNNLLIIESRTLAQRYQQEFDELATRKTRDYKKTKQPTIHLNLSGVIIEQYFCPQDNCEEHAIATLKKAKHEIVFMTFSFTADAIGDTLLQANNHGVVVRGVFEKRQNDQWSEHIKLKENGIAVITDNNKYTMHNKVFIIDNTTVITGSYNPTKNANTKNDENMLVITNKEIALQYREEFERLFLGK